MFGNALLVSCSHPHTPQALRSVLELVRRDGGRVGVLAVIEPAPVLQRLLTPHDTTEQVEAALRASVEHELRDWVGRVTGSRSPADIEIDVVTGHRVAAVLDRIEAGAHDLLVVTGHPDDPVGRAIVARLQRKSPVPVWAIRPSRDRKRRILAAIDTDDGHHALDARIFDAARWIARPGDVLHVATAWELVGEGTMRSSPFLSTGSSAVDELRVRCEAGHRATLTTLCAGHRFDDLDVHLHVENGAAADVIVGLVRRHHINQLVMGTIGRTGIPGFVIGNTAERLLSEVACSLLVVKPSCDGA